MKISREVFLQPGYELSWEEGVVYIEDYDLETEIIPYKLSNTLPEFSFYVARQLLRDLKGLNQTQFEEEIRNFNSLVINRFLPSPAWAINKSCLLHLSLSLGVSCLINIKLERDLQEWFLEAYVAEEAIGNYSALKSIVAGIASNPETHSRVLERISLKVMSEQVIFGLIKNPNLSNSLLDNIFRRFHHSPVVLGEVIKNWKGVTPAGMVMDLLLHSGSYNQEMISKLDISEEIMLRLNNGSDESNEVLRSSFYLDMKVRKMFYDAPVREKDL